MQRGSVLRGALARMPSGTSGAATPVTPKSSQSSPPPNYQNPQPQTVRDQGDGLQRVSPGIYRNAGGQLVNSAGGQLPANVYRQPGYAQTNPMQPKAPAPIQQPQWRPPAPYTNQPVNNLPWNFPGAYAGIPATPEPNQNMRADVMPYQSSNSGYGIDSNNQYNQPLQQSSAPSLQPGMAIGPGGRIMTPQQLQAMQQRNPQMFQSQQSYQQQYNTLAPQNTVGANANIYQQAIQGMNPRQSNG